MLTEKIDVGSRREERRCGPAVGLLARPFVRLTTRPRRVGLLSEWLALRGRGSERLGGSERSLSSPAERSRRLTEPGVIL